MTKGPRWKTFVQTDSELGEVLMRAFILRRVELIERGAGGVVLLGTLHCADTLRVKEFLTRNGHPFTYVDLESRPGCAAASRPLPCRRG